MPTYICIVRANEQSLLDNKNRMIRLYSCVYEFKQKGLHVSFTIKINADTKETLILLTLYFHILFSFHSEEGPVRENAHSLNKKEKNNSS